MFIENFNKIYGEHLYTPDTMYAITKDSMTITAEHHALRLKYISGKGQKQFTILLAKKNNSITCAIYTDGIANPLETFHISKMDLKSIDAFKTLISYKIINYE
ncbi:MAG: hypothetical protein RLZZ196_2787 [Bacteroidota bacterium]|jgi:hypothetical protein